MGGENYTKHKQALIAIEARIRKDFDNPALIAFGPISDDKDQDIIYIIRHATTKKSHLNEINNRKKQQNLPQVKQQPKIKYTKEESNILKIGLLNKAVNYIARTRNLSISEAHEIANNFYITH